MQIFLESFFTAMRPTFSRQAAYAWFVVVFMGFTVRTDTLGVSSVVRALFLCSNAYPLLLHFFHASSWTVTELREHWWQFLAGHAEFYRIGDRILVVGDDTKQPKGARRMPGVRTIHQHSETSSKPSFFRGHEWGFLCALTGKTPVATPVWTKLYHVHDYESRLADMLVQAVAFAQSLKQKILLVLDAGFVAGIVFKVAAESQGWLHAVVRAKKNCTAYFPPKKRKSSHRSRGRPRKYGDDVKVKTLFQRRERHFRTATVSVYGQQEEVQYFAIDLYWKPCKELVRFVLARTSIGPIVLMCSDLTLDPLDALRAYCRRVKIETFFDTLKNRFGGLMYHFWSTYLEPVSRRPRHNEPVPPPSTNPQATAVTAEAIEKFVHVQMLVIGVLQLMACRFPTEIYSTARCWLRTQRSDVPSEFVTRIALTNLIRQFLCRSGGGWIMQIIRDRQAPDYVEDARDMAA